MIAVDLRVYDQGKSTLANKVLLWGKYVAGLVGAKLDVIHIWNLFGEMTLSGRSVSTYTVDKLVQKEEQKHRLWLNESLSKKRNKTKIDTGTPLQR